MKRILLLLLIVIAINMPAFAATGASFLLIGTSARALAMGGAFTSVSNDISSINYNPSGLAVLTRGGLVAQHTQWISDINHDYFACAFPTKPGTIGASFTYLSQGSLEGRDTSGNNTGSFDASDSALAFSFSRRLSTKISAGANLKIINQQLAGYSATGVALDLGIISPVIPNKFQVGVAVQNLGTQMKFISESYNLPTNFAAGCGYNIGGLLLAFDVQQRLYDSITSFSMGAEFSPVQTLSLRGGYLLPVAGNSDNNKLFDGMKGLGAGLGLRLFGTQTDYTFVPYGDLGNTHRLSFSLQF